MGTLYELTATVREKVGKGAARATRNAGRVPAVIYGNKESPIVISIDPKELRRELESPGFYIRQFEIAVGDAKHRVLARDVQFHPVNDRAMHVDFLRVTEKTQIDVYIPVVFLNEEESPGLKRGGVLNVVRREIEVTCAVGNIPDEFTLDLSGMEIGDSAHISQIDLPDGVVPVISDRDFTIATVAAPTVVRDEAAAEAAEAEGEAAEGEEAEGEAEGGEEEGKAEEGSDDS